MKTPTIPLERFDRLCRIAELKRELRHMRRTIAHEMRFRSSDDMDRLITAAAELRRRIRLAAR